jgi:hypothetical protein
MKPQDLRVGSVIELLPEEKIVEATTVDITTYHDLYNRDSPNAKLYKPVRIKAEPLEKLGFKLYKGFGFWELEEVQPSYIKLMLSGGEWYPSIAMCPELSFEYAGEATLCKIKYIHELQNIYRVLRGEDMDVSKLLSL